MKARPSARSVSVIVFFVSVTTNLPKLFEYEVVRISKCVQSSPSLLPKYMVLRLHEL